MDEYFVRPPRRKIREPNLIPIIDMFTCVIFFLLLSTGFVSYTKMTLPPSQVSTQTDPLKPPPLSTKLLATEIKGELLIKLQWAGETPGETVRSLVRSQNPSDQDQRQALLKLVQEMAKIYKVKNPAEKTVQIGLGSNVPYQELLTIMDALKDFFPDFILISNLEAEAFSKENQG
jgi:biopolymer transport protein ExbD